MSLLLKEEVPTDYSRPCPKNGYYDVFLSFRGTDTRSGFTTNLYRLLQENKIHTFMDVKLLGQNIDDLFDMIGTSRMAIVIFSENFASSYWCLREMEMILQRRKEKKMFMLPIFYDVSVHELKHLSGKTGKHLDEHMPKHDESTVEKWKYAVTYFGHVSGLSYKDTLSRNDEYDFIMKVIATIKEKLGELEDNIIGLEKGSASHQDIEVYPQPRQEDRDSPTQIFKHMNTTTGEEDVYHVVTSAYFQTLSGWKEELLNIKPKYSLCFHVEKEKPSSSCLILTNQTDEYVAFTIQPAMPLKYSVRPNKGLLLPRSTCHAIVIMEAQSVISGGTKPNDKFEIQSVRATKRSYSTDEFAYEFKKESTNTIYNYSMYADYTIPSYPGSSIQDHCAQLSNKGLIQKSEVVLSIDIHPTKPWLLLCSYFRVTIWNYETRVEEAYFRIYITSSRYAKFIHEKQWIVVGKDKGFIFVFNYKTLEKVKEFKAHEDESRCVAVHPTLPYLLTTSMGLIKLWNWENDWACDQTFEGNSGNVIDVAFNPRDSRSFVSVSDKREIKIWSFDSSVAEFTLEEKYIRYSSVEYFIGNDNKLYLLCGSDSMYDGISVWDYESRSLVQILKGHSNEVTTTLVHSELSIIMTCSKDKTLCIWNKDTYQLELVWNCDLGEIYCITYIKASDEIVLGCKDGMVVIKIVNAEPERIGL